MAKKRSPQLLAYDRVLEAAKAIYLQDHKSEHGYLSWFAEQIGVSRQLLSLWGQRDGILPEYMPQVLKVTGLKREDIEVVTLKAPAKAWANICRSADKSDLDQIIIHKRNRA